MSKCSIRCPHCRKSSSFTLWVPITGWMGYSLNTELQAVGEDPDYEGDTVDDNRESWWECDGCGEEIRDLSVIEMLEELYEEVR